MRWTNAPEPWELEEELTKRIEARAQEILANSPICPVCGEYVDIYGLSDIPEDDDKYIDDDVDTYHYRCYLKKLTSEPETVVELAVSYIDEFYVKKPNRDNVPIG